MRDERKDALEKCLLFCKKDMEKLPVFLKRVIAEFGAAPKCISVIQLPIIYEKQRRYEEAIEVCEFALLHDLDDGTKGGFAERIEKLQKKINEGGGNE